MAKVRSLCVYCGASAGGDPRYAALAEAAGSEIAARGLRLVYGGAETGLMGVCARAALRAGGQVLGVIPEFLIPVEGAEPGVTLRKVATLASRKAMMIAEADAFLILPGGAGTIEEVFDLIAQRRLGLEAKPVAFLDAAYWAPMRALLEHLRAEGFAPPALTDAFTFAEDAPGAIDALCAGALGDAPR